MAAAVSVRDAKLRPQDEVAPNRSMTMNGGDLGLGSGLVWVGRGLLCS